MLPDGVAREGVRRRRHTRPASGWYPPDRWLSCQAGPSRTAFPGCRAGFRPVDSGFMTDLTRILSAIEVGDPSAAGQLFPLVYDELRRLAAEKMAQEKPGQTLQ